MKSGLTIYLDPGRNTIKEIPFYPTAETPSHLFLNDPSNITSGIIISGLFVRRVLSSTTKANHLLKLEHGGRLSLIVRPERHITEITTIELTTIELTTIEFTTIEHTTIELTTIELKTIEPTTIDLTTIDLTTIELTIIELTIIELTTIDVTTIDFTTIDLTIIELTTIELATIEFTHSLLHDPPPRMHARILYP